MLTYSELEAEELEYEDNAQFDYLRERFAGEDGSAEFRRSEYESDMAESNREYEETLAWVRETGHPAWKKPGYNGVLPGPEQIATHDILFAQSAAGIARAKKYFADNPNVPF